MTERVGGGAVVGLRAKDVKIPELLLRVIKLSTRGLCWTVVHYGRMDDDRVVYRGIIPPSSSMPTALK